MGVKPLPNPLLAGEGDIQADFELVNENLSASKTSGESSFMLLS